MVRSGPFPSSRIAFFVDFLICTWLSKASGYGILSATLPQPTSAVSIALHCAAYDIGEQQVGSPRDPFCVRIPQYQTIIQFADYEPTGSLATSVGVFISHAKAYLQSIQDHRDPTADIPSNSFTYTHYIGGSTIALTLRGDPSHVRKLAYDDIQELIMALGRYTRAWGQENMVRGARIDIFKRNGENILASGSLAFHNVHALEEEVLQ